MRNAVASAGPSSARMARCSGVPSLVGGGRAGRAARVAALRHQARMDSVAARATVRSVSSHPRLRSSEEALESLRASASNRYAQDTKSCIISIGLTSE